RDQVSKAPPGGRVDRIPVVRVQPGAVAAQRMGEQQLRVGGVELRRCLVEQRAYGGNRVASRHRDMVGGRRCPWMEPAASTVRQPADPDGPGAKTRGGHGAALKNPYRGWVGATGYGSRPRAPRDAAALHCPGDRAALPNPLAPDNDAWTEYAAAQKRLQA